MTLTVAGFGLGGLGQLELQLFADMDGVDVIAGADPSGEARKTFASEFDAPAYETTDELLNEHTPEIVNVASIHSVHREQVLQALDAGAHVHVEKPMTTTVEDAVALVDAAAASDQLVQVGYQRHFDPRFRELRECVESGVIGEPHFVDCHLEQDWVDYAKTWRGDPDLSGGGFLYDSGSHLLDVLLWVLDAEPVSVSATIDESGTGVDINSALSVELEREDGRVTASAALVGNGPTTPDVGDSLDIYGTDGRVSQGESGVARTEPGEEPASIPVEGETDFVSLTEAKLENLLDAIRDDTAVAVPPEHGLRAIALTEAAAMSAERGERVDVQALIENARSG
ncbi:Gfo/Idh/MocA family protein [Natranaeroarchaeum aerophilus]|uniref:Gfo/Idh/MocA family oxidoreductase n=1 Tax=Natranaeroarchaeum aerophilus TaxID=2917711 RepID=A0AAE3FPV5_9EURY|nr:Gfo/Idh/MocA family oxidoreductase [Natranaeroarchaeum aerophilus]MCL9813054.1 Gfo/Idh/MocA family oxidoreductase [Natranaeroarchaeum aerophilus]